MKELRKPPMISPCPPAGACRWCGGLITTGGRKDRNWHDGRGGEPDCRLTYRIAAFSADQREACLERDHGVCCDCDRDCIADNIAWQADHEFPLWLVDITRPRSEILVYWSLANLKTRCDDCHKAKSKREAAERAKMKRIHAKAAGKKTKHPLPKGRGFPKSQRKMPSRPFGTGHRPLRGRSRPMP